MAIGERFRLSGDRKSDGNNAQFCIFIASGYSQVWFMPPLPNHPSKSPKHTHTYKRRGLARGRNRNRNRDTEINSIEIQLAYKRKPIWQKTTTTAKMVRIGFLRGGSPIDGPFNMCPIWRGRGSGRLSWALDNE